MAASLGFFYHNFSISAWQSQYFTPYLPCLKCGRCIENCPAGLQPIQIKNAFDDKNVKDLESFDCTKCVECGMCSFVCPSKIELTDAIRKAKLYLRVTKK